jgi:class 3 adenylate cyclase
MLFRFVVAILVVAILWIPLLQAGLNEETGLYDFQTWTAKQFDASPQNWAIAQDSRGIMYFGNTNGLLQFDGVSWRLIKLPNGSGAMSVTIDATGTVYVGGSGDFGLLRPDATGKLHFVSLLDKVPLKDKMFADVWRILPTPQGTWFSSYSRLFLRQPDGNIKVWTPPQTDATPRTPVTFGRAFYALNTLYVKSSDKGLQRMRGGNLEPVAGGMEFAKADVCATVPWQGDALIGTPARIYRLTAAGAEGFPTAADSYFKANALYSMELLPNGDIAVGTKRGGLVLLDRSGNVERIITTGEGIPGNYVSALRTGQQGGVWMAAYTGITRFNPALSRFVESEGISGNVLCIMRQGGALYAGTTIGLFRMNTSPGRAPQFDQVRDVRGPIYVLLPAGNHLLAGGAYGLSAVSGDRSVPILENEVIYDLSLSPADPNTAYAAARNAAYKFRRIGNEWRLVASVPAGVSDFRTVLEDSDGRVWATTRVNVWRIDFRTEPPLTEIFGDSSGLPLDWKNAYRFQGRVVFATTKGLKRFSEASHRFVPDSSLGEMFSDGSHGLSVLRSDPDGNVWITGAGYHGVLRNRGAGYQWEPAPLLRSGITEMWTVFPEAGGIVWAAGAEGTMYRWEAPLNGDPNRNFRVLMRRAGVPGATQSLFGGDGQAPSIRLPFHGEGLRLEFAAPFYESSTDVEYQYRLEGNDRNWSAWTREARKDYTHLPEGKYEFHVRARNPHERVAEASALSFEVATPWYRSWAAYVLYVLCGGLFVWGVVRFRVRQLQEEKRQLETIVAERTGEIRQQRDEIQMQERKSHSLLLNILPATVADELKATGSVKPVGFDEVTVCFTDFVGFTLSSENTPPAQLVDTLNEYFTAFDEIIARYALEKLKTIGDSYMFVSGLPTPRKSHAVDAVLAAVEMVELVKRFAAKTGGMGWNIRVGLHSGPVVAGVVGTRKFAFDIWGSTVNFAARMESSGVPGHVNLSERTFRLTRGLIQCEERGNVRIKEGRELPMFLVCGPVKEFEKRYREEFGENPRSIPASEPSGQPTGITASA